MSTYLQLAVRARREFGMQGTGPAAVAGQTGNLEKVVAWVSDSYRDIQMRHANWRWLRSRFSVNTVADDDTYAYGDCTDTRLSATITRFAKWWLEDDQGYPNITAYLSATGVSAEYYLIPIDWETFRSIYKKGTQTSGMPIHVAVDPQDNLVLGPAPSAVYVVRGEYQMGPQILAADADTPEMPSRFHDLIVFRAMEKYAADFVASEKLARARLEGGRLMTALETDQVPAMQMGGPLA